jgi:hypothetical protein
MARLTRHRGKRARIAARRTNRIPKRLRLQPPAGCRNQENNNGLR